MKIDEVRISWFGAHPFRLPCNQRMAMASSWLSQNPPDIARFKNQFPDAMSAFSLLAPNEALSVGAVCAAKCPHREGCAARAQSAGCAALLAPA